jgi:hypothetical protein
MFSGKAATILEKAEAYFYCSHKFIWGKERIMEVYLK